MRKVGIGMARMSGWRIAGKSPRNGLAKLTKLRNLMPFRVSRPPVRSQSVDGDPRNG